METGQPQEDSNNQDNGDEDCENILCDGDIEWLVFLAVADFDNLALVGAVLAGNPELDTAVIICLSVGDTCGREAVEAAVLVPDQHRQRDALVVVEGNLPAVTVAEVFENDFLGVNLSVLAVAVAGFGGAGDRQQCGGQGHQQY